MSNYEMVAIEKSISIQREQFTRFKTAYDYLNKITFTINGMNIDLKYQTKLDRLIDLN